MEVCRKNSLARRSLQCAREPHIHQSTVETKGRRTNLFFARARARACDTMSEDVLMGGEYARAAPLLADKGARRQLDERRANRGLPQGWRLYKKEAKGFTLEGLLKNSGGRAPRVLLGFEMEWRSGWFLGTLFFMIVCLALSFCLF